MTTWRRPLHALLVVVVVALVALAATGGRAAAGATSGLCQAVADADRRIVQGRFGGRFRLAGAIAAQGPGAEAAVVARARSMLVASLSSSSAAGRYEAAALAAGSACREAGHPVSLASGIRCIRAPCP